MDRIGIKGRIFIKNIIPIKDRILTKGQAGISCAADIISVWNYWMR